MKTDVYTLPKNDSELVKLLDETEKAAVYNSLDKKQTIRLRLLAEELINMLPELLEYIKGEFWVESQDKNFELHLSATVDDMFSADREKLLSVSKSGKNAAATGIMGKVRTAFENMLVDYMAAAAYADSYYTMGIATDPMSYTAMWSLNTYKQAEKNKEDWDELEKSIIANLADDVLVGIKGRQVDIIIKKNFE